MGSKGSNQVKTQSTQTYTPNPYIAAAGQQAITGAETAAQAPFQMPVAPVAGFTPFQQQAFAQTQGMQGMAQPYFDIGSAYLGQSAAPVTGADVSQYYNPMAGNITAQMQNIFGQQMRQATGQATQAAGGVGADRIAVAQANLANQQGLAAGQTYAGLYQQALQAAQQQKQMAAGAGYGIAQMGPAAQAAYLQGTGALGAAGAQQQQLAQAQQNALYQQELARIAYPFQTPQYLAGITGGLAPAMGGTTSGQSTTTYPTPSPLSQILGVGTSLLGLGGMGGMFGGGGGKGGGAFMGGNTGLGMMGYPGATMGMYGGTPYPIFGKRGGRINPMADGGSAYGKIAEQLYSKSEAGDPYADNYQDGGEALPFPGASVPKVGGATPIPHTSLPMGAGHSGPLSGGINIQHQPMPQQSGSSGSGSSGDAGKIASAAIQMLPLLMAARGGGVSPFDVGQPFQEGGDISNFPFTPPEEPTSAPYFGGFATQQEQEQARQARMRELGSVDRFPTPSTLQVPGTQADVGEAVPPVQVSNVPYTPAPMAASTPDTPAPMAAPPPPDYASQPPLESGYPEAAVNQFSEVPPSMPRGRPLGAPDVEGNLLDRAGAAVKNIETGSPQGDYQNITTTTNPRTGRRQSALGAYQVMEDELPEWTTKVFGQPISKKEFLYGPHAKEIQDTLFRQMFGESALKYGQGDTARGIELAGREWFGGPGGVRNTGATDAFGRLTTGSYGKQVLASAAPQPGETLTGAPMSGETAEKAQFAAYRGQGPMGAADYQMPASMRPYPGAQQRDWGQTAARSPWMALVKAGAAMAQSVGPIGSVIGKGIAAGAGELEGQRKELRSEEDINQKAQHLYQQAQIHLDQYTKMTPYQQAEVGLREEGLRSQRYQWQPGTGIDPDTGARVSGAWRMPTRPGDKPEFMPGMNITGRGTKETALERNINMLVDKHIAPNEEAAFNILHHSLQDQATFQRLVQNEQKFLADRPENAGKSAQVIRAQAEENIRQAQQDARLRAPTTTTHTGTQNDPIPYSQGMKPERGKFYQMPDGTIRPAQ